MVDNDVDVVLDAACDVPVEPMEIMTREELVELVGKTEKGEGEFAGQVAWGIGIRRDLSSSESASFLEALKKRSDLPIVALREDMKKGADLRQLNIKQGVQQTKDGDDAVLDDEVRATLAAWNKKYAVVTMGGKVRILQEPSKPGTMPPLYEIDAFRTLMANDKVAVITGEGETKQEPLTRLWLEWPERRTYQGGIVFEPAGCHKDQYNLWRGFPVIGKEGDWSLLRGHILENICQGNQSYFEWVMTWLAQIFQQPGVKLGSSLVVKGQKGTGKSKLFDWVREAMGQHAIKVSHRRHIVGNFNSHQAGVLLMVCEEAFWAGDAEAGGVLKDIITSKSTMLERKGLDAVETSSFVRMAMVSNSDWVVPAGLDDERRYMVLECGKGRQKDVKFFASIDKQMEQGGVAAMVWDLEHWAPADGDWSILRNPPVTPWLVEQADQGTSLGEAFFRQLVGDGVHECPKAGDSKWSSTLTLHEVGDTGTELNEGRMVLDNGKWWLLWPITKLRHHYQDFTGEKVISLKNRRSPSDAAMFRDAERYLGATRQRADGRDWQWKDKGKCIAVPMRADILKSLDERGIPYNRTDCDDGEAEPS